VGRGVLAVEDNALVRREEWVFAFEVVCRIGCRIKRVGVAPLGSVPPSGTATSPTADTTPTRNDGPRSARDVYCYQQ